MRQSKRLQRRHRDEPARRAGTSGALGRAGCPATSSPRPDRPCRTPIQPGFLFGTRAIRARFGRSTTRTYTDAVRDSPRPLHRSRCSGSTASTSHWARSPVRSRTTRPRSRLLTTGRPGAKRRRRASGARRHVLPPGPPYGGPRRVHRRTMLDPNAPTPCRDRTAASARRKLRRSCGSRPARGRARRRGQGGAIRARDLAHPLG